MDGLQKLLQQDLDHICTNLKEELSLMSGKSLLVTGGAGFLGYYLVQSVLHWNRNQGAKGRIKVTVFDNYVRGVPTWLLDLEKDPDLTLVRHDMSRPLPEKMASFQYIIHAAGIASPTYYRKYPIETIDANINGLRYLLEYSREQQHTNAAVEGVLFYSSSEIYGDPPADMIPTPEDYRGNVSCTGPRACYDESKRFGETICVNFARQYGLPVSMARPFNNYGPGLKITDRRVIPDFARDIFTGKDIVLLSDGSPTRTFCYSADAIVGYYKILVKGQRGEAYNIGVEKPEISMYELALKLAAFAREMFGYQGTVIRQYSKEADYLVDNPNRRCPIIAKARSHLGYNPQFTIDAGLKNTLLWYSFNQTAEEA